MAFLVYKREFISNEEVLTATGEHFSLAGYKLIYNSWVKRGKPLNQGWHLTTNDLVAEQTNGQHTSETRRLLIDFDPNSRKHVGLIELMDVYVFSYSGSSEIEVFWSVLMLRIRSVRDETGLSKSSSSEIQKLKDRIVNPNYGEPNLEFLYLKGSDEHWNWGMSGRTNAVFLDPQVREYFRQFF
jgi:hypothetical protein